MVLFRWDKFARAQGKITPLVKGDHKMTIRSISLASPGLCAGATVLIMSGGAGAEPQPWQLGLQAPAGSIAEKATSLHNLLLVIITAISLFVLALLVYTCVRFRQSANSKPSKTTHNAVIEVLWTVIPVLILVVIAVPSFRLLYYMDKTKDTEMVIKITGNQWYWNYEYPDEGLTFDSYMIDEAELGRDRSVFWRWIIRWLCRPARGSSFGYWQ